MKIKGFCRVELLCALQKLYTVFGQAREGRSPGRGAPSPQTSKRKKMQKKLSVFLCCVCAAALAQAEQITLSWPTVWNDNGGHGYTSRTAALTNYANSADGAYMFNGGGKVGTNTGSGEGIPTTVDGDTSLTLCPRTTAGGTGEAFVLSATNDFRNASVNSLTFSIAGSSSATISGDVTLTLAIVQKQENTGSWSVLKQNSGSLTLGSRADLKLTLDKPLKWSDSYKVVALVDNLDKSLSGNNGNPYTLSGIQVKADITVPEPATATMSLMALAGLCARRRRQRV
ncbi:MAG: PEP-CTERM sorting domain-containing protein [Akkermansia muciniphila]|nr:PEP-CTERM sorting domain-containing protein [Akkermansia muciniphila]